jgi:hypothetical protein
VPTLKKPEMSQINLMMHRKLLEKQEQTKPQTNRWREIVKIRAEINEIETNKTKQNKKQTNKKL